MPAFYNEIDPFAAAWLRELIAAGRIAPGVVDERDIRDIRPADLAGFDQCHFFAGIGVWSYALRRAGWPDDRPVWTGSCPCQPFSAAGKGGGFDDERHLWPAWHWLIEQCRPGVVFGEQVASRDGLSWLDLVSADLEGTGYALGAFDLCAAGFGAPHIRQRLWLVAERLADASSARLAFGSVENERAGALRDKGAPAAPTSVLGRLADAALDGHGAHGLEPEQGGRQRPTGPDDGEVSGGLADASGIRRIGRQRIPTGGVHDGQNAGWLEGDDGPVGLNKTGIRSHQPGPVNGFWSASDWLYCRDGKWRPVEPGTFPLVDGAPARVGRLRGYGNAINAEAAAGFFRAYLESEPMRRAA